MDQALINRIVEAALLAANQPLALAQLHALFPEDAPAPPNGTGGPSGERATVPWLTGWRSPTVEQLR